MTRQIGCSIRSLNTPTKTVVLVVLHAISQKTPHQPNRGRVDDSTQITGPSRSVQKARRQVAMLGGKVSMMWW